MKVNGIDHIGIAVRNIDAAKEFYTDILGLTVLGVEIIEEQKVKVCFIPCGDSEIELIESTSPEGPIAKFLDAKGEGIQHLALRVDDIEAAIAEMKAKGFRMIDEKSRYGAGGAKIAFVHPKATNGVLLELSQR
jgi:methylmalonyl-CoA/ethylmalonyl-CoA epimerase